MHGQASTRLNDDTPVLVEDRRRVIVSFLDIGGMCALHERDKRLVGRRRKGAEHDFERDGIVFH
jgi:hypothetical protein